MYVGISLNSSLFTKEFRFILFIRPKPVARLFIRLTICFRFVAANLFGRPPNSFILLHCEFLHFIPRTRLFIFAPQYDASPFLRTELRLSIFFSVLVILYHSKEMHQSRMFPNVRYLALWMSAFICNVHFILSLSEILMGTSIVYRLDR